ncbi:MAG: N-acetyltransferase [Actinomycetota bacterium]|nr:N-acetyltransferase [Actinomycetota bacterium]MDQ6947816.1 N-acetyltransferase [Actinomycetota bacterium]
MAGSSIHPTAVVEDGVVVGDGTKVWHHAHVRQGASIGSDCILGKNVYVDAWVVIGDRVKLQNNVSVYSGVELGDDVFVGPGAVFTNDRVPRASGSWRVSPTRVSRGASIGANATLIAGNDVGESAMVGAGAVVTRPVGDHEIVVGNPARLIGWVCRCGAVRRIMGAALRVDCATCGTEFVVPSADE